MLRPELEKNTRMPTYTIDPLFVNRLIRLPGSNRFMLNQATEALQMPKYGKIVERGVIDP
jgi:hypothetical protein